MSRLIIDQFTEHALERHDLTPTTNFMRDLNLNIQDNFRCIRFVDGESVST